jgi:hypothetical protein
MTEPARAFVSDATDRSNSMRHLAVSTARRIRHQIDRSVQGTYGAHNGLRELVQLGALQMLSAGASREDIRREMTRCISERPESTITAEPALSRHKAAMVELTRLMILWADGTEQPPAPPARRATR